ncbi:hypothetical protein OXYTRIMIC_317 [Oxytricha trifallax]|uniref:Uncharacterized protein n=1 Tax=Oxytricha trifallax TaxID=1172189 RepID=A0A073HZR2_9SPIT|nr:hypothetical protein OXYTRIMIC_317 [Oxytricha trifallax]
MARHYGDNSKKKAVPQKKIQGQPMNLSPVSTKIQNKQQYEVQEGRQTYTQNIKMKVVINGVQGQPINIQPTFNSIVGGNQNVMKNLNQVQRKSPARPHQTTTTTTSTVKTRSIERDEIQVQENVNLQEQEPNISILCQNYHLEIQSKIAKFNWDSSKNLQKADANEKLKWLKEAAYELGKQLITASGLLVEH